MAYGDVEVPLNSAQEAEAMGETLQDKLSLFPHAEEDQQATPHELHIVMVPYPLQGHINPMMQLAKTLIATYHAKISFVNIKHHHDRIQRTCFRRSSPPSAEHDYKKARSIHAHLEDELQDRLDLLWIDNGLPDDFDYSDLNEPRFRDFHIATCNMREPLKQLLQSLNQKSPPISCVIFGSFSPWVHPVATELHIPSIFFWTQSTAVLSIYYHVPLLDANGFFPYKKHALSGCNNEEQEESQETSNKLVSYIPGIPPIHPSKIPTLLHIDGLSSSWFSILREQMAVLPSCQGLIVNSVEELEKDAYQALQEELPFPVSLVGPLIPSAFLEGDANDTTVGASLYDEKVDCIEWLNHQKKQSVSYVSFGSLCNPSPEDIVSIANGIKQSKKPFLWVIRPRSSLADVAEILPKGFMDDTKDQGIIIPWAPQVQVLSHASVGLFLTHCGWNSTLESVSMGVPMIGCPMFSDQPTNCLYVCKVWKIGMELKRHDDGALRSADVERAVRTVLEEREGEEMRKRATQLRQDVIKAARAGGSSGNHLEEFIQSMRNHKGAI